MNERIHLIVHPSDQTQSDWVRLLLPMLQFMVPNEFQILPTISQIPINNKEILKRTKAVILQKPTMPGHAQTALMYSKLKQECGFKLLTDMDDLMWDLSPIIRSYAPPDVENIEQHTQITLRQVLSVFDAVICSTRYLASRIKSDLSVKNVVVMPNGVSQSLFGFNNSTQNRLKSDEKIRVMYAGNLGHTKEGYVGDFEGPWIPWLRENIEKGTFDFYIFGCPDFLQDLEGKFKSIPYTSTLQFPATAASIRPHFYLAPLTSNNFNRAKSDLKLKEAAALDAVFIGSDFAGSPYRYAPKNQLVPNSATKDDLNNLFQNLCNPENFQLAIQWQRQLLEEKHCLHEDPIFQQNFTQTYFL